MLEKKPEPVPPPAPAEPAAKPADKKGIDAMKNWPWYGYLLFAVLIFALAFFFYFKPQNTKLKALKAERVKVEGEVQNLKQKKRELDKIEADIAAMTAKLKTLEVNIPQRKETADILRQIQALAYDSRLDVLRFAPGNEINKEFYAEWPIPIQVSGNYHNLGTVLRPAEQVRPGVHHRELHHQDPDPPDGPEHDLRQLDGQDLLLRRDAGGRRAGQKTSEAKTMRKTAILLMRQSDGPGPSPRPGDGGRAAARGRADGRSVRRDSPTIPRAAGTPSRTSWPGAT